MKFVGQVSTFSLITNFLLAPPSVALIFTRPKKANLVSKSWPRPPALQYKPGEHYRHVVLEVSSYRSEFLPLEDGLGMTIDWYVENQSCWREVREKGNL